MLETRTPTHICAYALAKLLEKCKQLHGLQRYLSTHCVTFVIEHYSLEWNLKRLDLLDGLVEFPRKPTTIRHVIGGAVAILKTAFQTFFNLPSRIYCNFDWPALLKRGDIDDMCPLYSVATLWLLWDKVNSINTINRSWRHGISVHHK